MNRKDGDTKNYITGLDTRDSHHFFLVMMTNPFLRPCVHPNFLTAFPDEETQEEAGRDRKEKKRTASTPKKKKNANEQTRGCDTNRRRASTRDEETTDKARRPRRTSYAINTPSSTVGQSNRNSSRILRKRKDRSRGEKIDTRGNQNGGKVNKTKEEEKKLAKRQSQQTGTPSLLSMLHVRRPQLFTTAPKPLHCGKKSKVPFRTPCYIKLSIFIFQHAIDAVSFRCCPPRPWHKNGLLTRWKQGVRRCTAPQAKEQGWGIFLCSLGSLSSPLGY